MAGGGEGSPRRRTAKSLLEDAATGSQAQLRKCSTKRKAGKEAASGRMPRPRASGRKETASAVAPACADTAKANRLPAKDIRWILAQKPEAPRPRYQALKSSNPELVPRPGEEEDKKLMALYGVTRAFYEVQEKLPKLQEWVRSELREKGYVLVDDEWLKRTAEAQAYYDREWPRIKAKMEELRLMDELRMMDGPCLSEGDDESESDSFEEEDEDAALASVIKDYM